MDLQELNQLLKENGIPEAWYSINDGLKPGACILYKNDPVWEFFYLDERGNRVDYKTFADEAEAYRHLWEKMRYQLKVAALLPWVK
ncbi:hypothetical protein [Mucilaginibacter paludis]|uniref:Uncharacterized protein n=1 Tax=Mucilaginibacter paludis DSM 18603 TaxID=714943 RepID=H1Y4P9_9SPHI|nr:hypothetical protein [Mucilaginibacter paludis]EHQ28093.1 hypothetical protein Mucpa_4002 [Mucilaginibacter paludis DSM 18603]